jgi:hypothetical protein
MDSRKNSGQAFWFCEGSALCVGQNQMCHLCGWLKIELKKCAVGKIKNTEGSAMSVGSVAVQLKYGLYVGHLSKLAFHFMFKIVRLVVVVSSVRLACNGFGLCVRAGFGAQNCQPALNLNRSTKLQVCTSARLTQNPC